MSHTRDAFSSSQNVGNVLGSRPCVRQTALYRHHESGNAMKDLLGMGHLAWDREPGGRKSGPSAAYGIKDDAWETLERRNGSQSGHARGADAAAGDSRNDLDHIDCLKDEIAPDNEVMSNRGGHGQANHVAEGGGHSGGYTRGGRGSLARGRGRGAQANESSQAAGPRRRVEAAARSPSVGSGGAVSSSSTPGHRRQTAQRGGYPTADPAVQAPAQSPAQRAPQARAGN
mmetsp:Transcript_49236/g.86657  ORF Transcript_49236/g.86657 Transcript_49236/m.86657 type:complete len:229 (-) Transcript_49236:9-695(-)